MSELICWSCGSSNEGTEKTCVNCSAPLDVRMSNALREHITNARMKASLVYIIEGVILLVALAAVFVNVQQARDSYVHEHNQSKVTSTPVPSPSSTPVAAPPRKGRKR